MVLNLPSGGAALLGGLEVGQRLAEAPLRAERVRAEIESLGALNELRAAQAEQQRQDAEFFAEVRQWMQRAENDAKAAQFDALSRRVAFGAATSPLALISRGGVPATQQTLADLASANPGSALERALAAGPSPSRAIPGRAAAPARIGGLGAALGADLARMASGVGQAASSVGATATDVAGALGAAGQLGGGLIGTGLTPLELALLSNQMIRRVGASRAAVGGLLSPTEALGRRLAQLLESAVGEGRPTPPVRRAVGGTRGGNLHP